MASSRAAIVSREVVAARGLVVLLRLRMTGFAHERGKMILEERPDNGKTAARDCEVDFDDTASVSLCLSKGVTHLHPISWVRDRPSLIHGM